MDPLVATSWYHICENESIVEWVLRCQCRARATILMRFTLARLRPGLVSPFASQLPPNDTSSSPCAHKQAVFAPSHAGHARLLPSSIDYLAVANIISHGAARFGKANASVVCLVSTWVPIRRVRERHSLERGKAKQCVSLRSSLGIPATLVHPSAIMCSLFVSV